MDTQNLVRAFYLGLLGREPEETSLAHFCREIGSGFPAEDVFRIILDSKECRRRMGARTYFPIGHFYSPICDVDDVKEFYRDPETAHPGQELPGLSLDEERHVELWTSWRRFLADIPFQDSPAAGLRYYFDNTAFSYADAITLYCMLRWLRPRRYYEIGSGFSSACCLDTNERFLGNAIETTFIDPYPERLASLLRPGDSERITILPARIQEIDPARFDALQENDILFIDSTHVVKTCSDLTVILFEVLPRLAPGVYIHFHDIFFPFEYIKDWAVEDNRSWNEAYVLRAFLMDNDQYEIVFFNDFFQRFAKELIDESCPAFGRNTGGSLWLRKVRRNADRVATPLAAAPSAVHTASDDGVQGGFAAPLYG